MKHSATTIGWTIIAVVIFGIVGVTFTSEDTEQGILMTNIPYNREMDGGMELARIFLIPQRMYHPKRNSELINSLLGLPKNMNNAGRK